MKWILWNIKTEKTYMITAANKNYTSETMLNWVLL